jgi:hypothetical protein
MEPLVARDEFARLINDTESLSVHPSLQVATFLASETKAVVNEVMASARERPSPSVSLQELAHAFTSGATG